VLNAGDTERSRDDRRDGAGCVMSDAVHEQEWQVVANQEW
jgi:hypothetical protein